LEIYAPLGCGLQTGAGAVLNVLKVVRGSSIAIIGVGPVGLAAVMAAKIAQAETIIAVDIHQSRLDLAISLGATHAILSKDNDIDAEIRKIIEDGVEYAIDSSGVPRIIESMMKALIVRGKGVTIASPGQGQKVSINIFDHLLNGRSYIGTHQGDSNPAQVNFPIDLLLCKADFSLSRF
jgi:Zn-dependent alcohol dehydrogenase